jgi:hypothetical protein
MECADTAFSTDARIVPSQPALEQIVSTSHSEVVDDGDIWMSVPPVQQPIWPRVWPGL